MNHREFPKGSLLYVATHGIARIRRGKNPSSHLLLIEDVTTDTIRDGRCAFELACAILKHRGEYLRGVRTFRDMTMETFKTADEVNELFIRLTELSHHPYVKEVALPQWEFDFMANKAAAPFLREKEREARELVEKRKK